MKLLLDQGLPRSTVGHLANLQISAEHVGNLGMAAATDDDIIIAARKFQAWVVTLDADFHAILAATNATNPSVIRIRREGLKGADLAEVLQQVLNTAQAELALGAAVSVTETQVRIRLLLLA